MSSEGTKTTKRSDSSWPGARPESLNLLPARHHDPTMRWRVTAAVLTVLLSISIVGNVALGVTMGNYLRLRGQRDRAVDAQAAAEHARDDAASKAASTQASWEESQGQLRDLQAALDREKATQRRLQERAEEASTDPRQLPVVSKRLLLKRVRSVRVTSSMGDVATEAGIRAGAVLEEAKATVKRDGFDLNDDSTDTIIVAIDGIEPGLGGTVWIITVSLQQRFRAHGTDGAISASVYEEGQIVALARKDDSQSKVLEAVAATTSRLCAAITEARSDK